MSTCHLGIRRALPLALIVALAGTGAGCSSSAGAPLTYDSGVGGPVTGALDNHCVGVDPIVVSQASCHPAASDAGVAEPDAAAGDDAAAPEPEAPVLYNAEGDDDDCKYHVKIMVTAAKQGQNATIQVTLTYLADGMPATGAAIEFESYLADNDTHVLPNGTKTSEKAGTGVYTLSPVKFDASGRWVFRLHFFHSCSDALEDSPHGHAAFFIDVVP
jgi:hypothetical protein